MFSKEEQEKNEKGAVWVFRKIIHMAGNGKLSKELNEELKELENDKEKKKKNPSFFRIPRKNFPLLWRTTQWIFSYPTDAVIILMKKGLLFLFSFGLINFSFFKSLHN